MEKLALVVPAFNEAPRIVRTLTHTLAYLRRQSYASEILVVSDGSSDDTTAVVRSFAADAADRVALKALEYHPNRGKGYAVRYGMLQADGDVIMFMDADYSVPIEALADGLRLMDGGCEIAIASRALRGSRVQKHQHFFRELSGKAYTLIQNAYLGIRYRDTQCGFKLFSRRAARELFSRQKLDSVIFDPEILWLAKRGGFKVGEFPVHWSHVADSRIQYDNLRKSLFIFQELLRIRRVHPQG